MKNQLARFGFTVNLYPKIVTEGDSVYGVYSGESSHKSHATPIRALVPGKVWTVTDEDFAGGFQSGYLWTTDTVNTGDILEFDRTDGTKIRFKIVQPEGIGTEENVVIRFKIAPLGD